MRRAAMALALVLAALGSGLAPGSAAAHPLGNFTINHVTEVRVSSDRIGFRYILDQAEIPTFQARRRSRETRLDEVHAELRRNLRLTVDGRPATVEVQPGSTFELLPGQGGLQTTRIEVTLVAPSQGARRVVVRDETYGDRVGWKAIVARPGDGTRVRASVPSEDVTKGLRSYPKSSLSTPVDQRVATFSVEPGDGELEAAGGSIRGGGQTREQSAEDGFSGLFASAAAGEGVLLFLLLAAFGGGALHALSPGNGKAMVAAYLVGTRGTSRDAVALGAVVTVTHTIGVFALGLVTLVLAQYIVPDDLYPWLNVVSGLLVVAIGGAILWSRLQVARGRRATAFGEHHHGDGHEHVHGHHHHHHHDDAHHHHHHGHDHEHGTGRSVSRKGILGMGASAGLIPCPSALVVLLGAVSQQQIVLGMALILTFSIGLAATLTALGLLVVRAGTAASRLNVPPVLSRALPAASALVIVVAGAVLTGRALPGVV